MRTRPWVRLCRFTALLTAPLLTAGMLAGPAAAAPAPPPAPPIAVTACGSVGAATAGTFVAQWTAHLADDAYLKAYLGGAGRKPLPDATDDERACLINQLVAALAATHPDFGAGRDPKLVRALLTAIVFDRGTPKAVTASTAKANAAAPSSALGDALGRLRGILPLQVPSVTPTLDVGSTTTVGADAMLTGGPSATPIVSAHAGASFVASDTALAAPLDTLPTPAELLDLVGRIIGAVTYRVCVESAAVALNCSIPTPFLVPVLVDDTGDHVPDVVATLSPVVTLTGGVGLQFHVATLPLIGHTAPAHVFALFNLGGTTRQFTVGFDGRASRLASTSTMKFLLKSLVRALTGDIDTGFDLKYTNPGPRTGITFSMGIENPDNSISDPVTGALNFDPTPANFHADLRIQDTATPEYTVGIQSTVPTTLTAQASIEQTAAATRTEIAGLIKELPSSINLDVTNAGSVTTADYSGSAKIDDIQLSARSIPDTAHPDTYTDLGAELTQIPSDMHLVVTEPYDAVLSTSSPIGPASVSEQKVTDGVLHSELSGQIALIPAHVHLHGDVTGAGDDFTAAFTYQADSSIPSVSFRLFDDQDLHAFVQASAADLPKYMTVSVAKHPHSSSALFDARTDAGAAPGSSSVGPISLKYTSTGTQLADADLPSTDYVVMKETDSDVQAALRYTGLALVRYSLVDDVSLADHDTVSAEIHNAAPRLLTIEGDTPAALVSARIDKVPASMKLDYEKVGTATNVHYSASSAIDEISAAVATKNGNHAAIGADVMGVPNDVRIAMNQAHGTLDWTASAHVSSIDLTGSVDSDGRTYDGAANLTDVPSQWSLGFGPSSYFFQGGTALVPQAVGSVSASITDHGSVSTSTVNHAFANYDQSTGALDASFTMSQVTSFSYVPTAAGFTATTRMGGGQPFRIKAKLYLDDSVAHNGHLDVISADTTISPLPASMTFTQDGTALDYTSDTSPDIDASVALGRADAVAATPTPPVVRGASLRDGRACDGTCATAYKAHLFLQGAPSGLHADLKDVDYAITHYAPPATDPSFNADVLLTADPDPSKHVVATLSLKGIDPAGQDMHLGPLTTAPGPVDGSETTSLAYNGNHAVGPLDASVTFGDKTARLVVSNLPASMSFSATTRPDGLEVSGSLQDPIEEIDAYYKPTGATNWALTGSLKQIPRTFDLSELTIAGQSVPTVSYTASNGADSPDTLDIAAAVDLHQLSDSVTGQVQAGITNLGHDTHANWDGTKLVLDSTPRTDLFEVHVPNAQVVLNYVIGSPDSGHDFISITASGHVNVVVDIANAGMTLSNVAHVEVQPGFSTGVKGDFGTFSFGWQGLHVDVNAAVEVDLDIDFGGGIEVSPTLASLAATISTVVNVDFAIYHQEQTRILHIFPGVPVPCSVVPPGIYFIDVFITPKRIGTGHNGFTINGSPGTSDTWVVTINPFGIVPDLLLDGITGLFTSPYDKGLDAGFNCSA